ncbi:MAG: TIGR02996 domain-containing protein [Planctomycetaceae bacterium]
MRPGTWVVDEKTFLDEIISDPGDHQPRLIYADWLEDHGDPRGEFIRLQIERESHPHDPTRNILPGTRESMLFEANSERWVAPLLKLGIERTAIGFRWGFIDAVGVSCRTAASHIAAIRDFCPLLRRLYLHGAYDDRIDQVSGSPHLQGLIQIGIQGQLTSENVRRFFFDTPGLETLKAIDCSETNLGDAGLAELLAAPQLQRIIALDLNSVDLSWRGAGQILSWRLAPQLEWLNLRQNSIGDRGGKLIARTQRLNAIKHLNLALNGFSRNVVEELRSRWGDAVVS